MMKDANDDYYDAGDGWWWITIMDDDDDGVWKRLIMIMGYNDG